MAADDGDPEDFVLHLGELHYEYADETHNPAYRMFLGA